MADDNSSEKNISVSVPVGAIATAIVLGLAAAAYALLGRNGEESDASTSQKTKSGNMRRKLGLMTLIAVIENDASRKVLLALLRAIARRS
jgi:hypothetical protein